MKRIILLASLTLFLFTACHQKGNTEKNPIPASEAKGAIKIKVADLATDKDLVCGMKLEGESIGDTILYDGKIYGFCSPECKAEFIKNPQSYLAQQ